MGTTEFRYEKLTWPEINEAARAGKLILIPTAAIEDHGYHLPLDTDVMLTTGVCRRAAERLPDQVLLMPPVLHGYLPHHADFPGGITIGWKTFVDYGLDITRSLTHHGFRRILLINGHGSNRPLVEMIARLTIVERPDVLCAAASWWEMQRVREVVETTFDSKVMSHACELETSVYLALDPGKVQMDKTRPDVEAYRMSPHVWSNLPGLKPDPSLRNAVSMMEYWSVISETGTRGDPTTATKQKGEAVIEAAAAEIADIVRELQARPIRPRVDHHRLG